MTRPTILFADNEPSFAQTWKELLEQEGFRVIVAQNPIEARRALERSVIKLAILDIRLVDDDDEKDVSGLRLAKEVAPTVPKIIFTSYPSVDTVREALRAQVNGIRPAVEFLWKGEGNDVVIEKIKHVLERVTIFRDQEDHTRLQLLCIPGHLLDVTLDGVVVMGGASRQILEFDAGYFSRTAEGVRNQDTRFPVKQLGKEVFDALFAKHAIVSQTYRQILGRVGQPAFLHLAFESTRDFLRAPIEFAYDGTTAQGKYLVLKHPLSRQVRGTWSNKSSLRSLINQLWRNDEVLKVLLIASNTTPSIPGADREIESLGRLIKTEFAALGLRVAVTTLPTHQATYDDVRSKLQRCPYHIVHYAGHGWSDVAAPEKSSLLFWEKRDRSGTVREMPASELALLMQESETRLVYLSCCAGTETAPVTQLLSDDFLGLADSLIHAGVPTVLGYRWPVSDVGAPILVRAFYQSLARCGQPDVALLAARREVAESNRDDPTWLSPVLINQVA